MAQTIYTPYQKARKSTEFILIDNARDAKKLVKKFNRFPLCSGLKIDARSMNRQELSDILIFVGQHPDITELSVQYMNNDSLDFGILMKLKNIETLTLKDETFNYSNIQTAGTFDHLYKLGLYLQNIGQLPPFINTLHTLGEIDLYTDTLSEFISTDFTIYYRLNDTLDNCLTLNSYVTSIDLTQIGTRALLLSMWPEAEEKKTKYTFVQSTPEKHLFMTDPVINYKPNPHLTPLIKDNKPVFENRLISPEIENTVVFKDETTLTIPADAFITADGKAVEGDIKILYRSIRTPADILNSGLTMFYDTAGKKEMFRTNGMFEIRAYANAQELQLKSDKKIGMDFKTKKDSTDFNLYTLNETTGKWEYNQNLFSLGNVNSQITMHFMKDRTAFADRYTDLSYTYVLPEGVYTSVTVPYLSQNRKWTNDLFKFKSTKSGRKIKPGKSLFRLRIDPERSDNKIKKVSFFLLNSALSKNNSTLNYFPELRPFDGFTFEYDGNIKTSEFAALYKKGKCYTDCRIYYENNADNAIIELKTKQGFISIPVKAVITNYKGRTRVNLSLKRAYNKYLRLLSIKESKFNKTVDKGLRNSIGEIDSNIYYRQATKKKTNRDQSMYRMDINVLGFFNCDQLYRIQQPMMVMDSKFICADSMLSNVMNAFVVDSVANGSYSFSPMALMLSYNNMSGLIISDQDGNIYTCTGDSFRQQVLPSDKIEKPVLQVRKMPKASNAEAIISKL